MRRASPVPRARRPAAIALWLSLALAGAACRAQKAEPPPPIQELEQLDVDDAGKRLMRAPLGLSRVDGSTGPHDTAVVAVHGYQSRGKEWITPLSSFARSDVALYFYHWDDSSCPDTAVPKLKAALDELVQQSPQLRRLIVVGHSYGGVITALMTQGYSPGERVAGATMEVHIIASPLASMPTLERLCKFTGVPEAPPPVETTSWRQWRTVKEQDGAFKDLDEDPQQITLPRLEVTQLPATQEDGERLGHNRSISWVAAQLHPLTPADASAKPSTAPAAASGG